MATQQQKDPQGKDYQIVQFPDLCYRGPLPESGEELFELSLERMPAVRGRLNVDAAFTARVGELLAHDFICFEFAAKYTALLPAWRANRAR